MGQVACFRAASPWSQAIASICYNSFAWQFTCEVHVQFARATRRAWLGRLCLFLYTCSARHGVQCLPLVSQATCVRFTMRRPCLTCCTQPLHTRLAWLCTVFFPCLAQHIVQTPHEGGRAHRAECKFTKCARQFEVRNVIIIDEAREWNRNYID